MIQKMRHLHEHHIKTGDNIQGITQTCP